MPSPSPNASPAPSHSCITCQPHATAPHPPSSPPLSQRLADVVNDEGFRSLEGKSKHQLWLELCDLVTKHPNEVKVRGGWAGGGLGCRVETRGWGKGPP